MVTADDTPAPRRILLVSGLSGAGKSSILRILEDLEHEVIDNPPLGMLDDIVARAERPVAIGVDSRTRGFDASAVLEAMARLRMNPHLRVELIYATADESVLLRRYTATRRRHPLAPHGSIKEGIEEEIALTAPLRAAADLVIDTTDMPPPELRQFVESRFSPWTGGAQEGLTVALMSFAYPAGLPREADIVFDARFLRNPHYVPELAPKTGLDADVAEYVAEDRDYLTFLNQIHAMLQLVLPRFVQEGKKYATIAIGCSGGRHRSVTLVEALAKRLSAPDGMGSYEGAGKWPIMVMHRELARQGITSWRWARKPVEPALSDQSRSL
ncbi:MULTISPECIES: RNase adapter RapZ [Acetobacter]|uniref:RNase adapter RapZ n=2 Tax=Acetobacter TaxID=434 RepID=A0AAN1PJ95_9PROT|nr:MULTISPECIES: RNase adapter RapZ [Acetobacter]ANA12841.1 glmZ(sRNA)-inactivating NTPase [Acetobacter oryzifermentans]ASL39236.1 RNase adaptor protein RapZ [Acetobacter oryzifermentans]AXN01361.1 RNase adapter RapZ [Acetobacter pomorum]KAA8384873.1 RNase adapter RapZ [Acetobacter sp. DmW_136]KAA8397792.1 RNase adapter RapZ [Acetobacter sp. DmW_125127]